jgi:phosphatidylglycerophosphate synthase
MAETRRPIAARDTKWAAVIAQKLARSGVKPNHISVMSVVFGCVSGACLVAVRGAEELPAILLLIGAAVAIQLRLLCNLFDGMVAIEGGFKTKSGEIFNDMPDRLADPVILICAGYAIATYAWATELGWLAGLLAVMTAYVRVLGSSTGTKQYFLGPMAKQHRMAIMTAAFVAAAATVKLGFHERIIMTALIVVCAGCLITVMRRTVSIVRELESK